MKSALSGQAGSTTLFGAGAIIILTLMSLGIKASHAALDLTLPEPLFKQGIPLSEETDGPFRYWNRRKKYFLVIAVNQTDVPKTELPFALVDGQLVVNALIGLGYQPLDPDHPILTGKDATRTAIVASISKARAKEEEATIIVYYTGHGAVGAKDLWLQTVGQVEVGDAQGIAVADLIVRMRRTASGKAFEGELVLIIDACYSGQGTLSQALTVGDMGRQTTILTSSTDIQESFSLNPPVVRKQMSAFTHTFLQALGPDWAQADSDGDGLLRWEELRIYAVMQLRQFKELGALAQLMRPSGLSNYPEGFLTYQRDRVRVWHSNYRDNLTTQEMNDILAAPLQGLRANPKETPVLPKDSQRLAQQFDPAPEDYYGQAVKATAEGQLKKARPLFAKAETQSQERAAQADAAKQRETGKLGQIYLARARMETYAGQFSEAFSWYQQAAKLSPPTTPELLNQIGSAGVRAGKYPEAGRYLTRALQQREQDLTPGHPDLATSLNNLAVLYRTQGKYAAAEPFYQRALRIDEAALGATHPNVARDLNNLGELYYTQWKFVAAEPLFQRAIAIFETALGPERPSVATALNNLAELYRTQGKYAKAEPLYQRVIAIFETALGPDHPLVATSLNNLGILYYSQGKYVEAEPLYQRAIRIDEAALGPTHPDVARDLNNLAALYQAQGKYVEAEPLYQRALRIEEAALSPTHPNVARDLNNLAALYQAQGKYVEAEPLYQRALGIDEAALGPTHSDVASDLGNLAALYQAQRKYAAAEPLYPRVITIFEAALGLEHPLVATSLNNLAELYRIQGKYAEAEPLYQRALRIDETALGPTHPDVASVLNNLAVLYQAQGRYAAAEPLLQRALRIREAALGATHPDVGSSLNNLAELYRTQGKYAEAEPLYQRSFWILHNRFGPEHPSVRQVFANYQAFLKAIGQAYTENDTWEKMRSSSYSQTSMTHSP